MILHIVEIPKQVHPTFLYMFSPKNISRITYIKRECTERREGISRERERVPGWIQGRGAGYGNKLAFTLLEYKENSVTTYREGRN